MVDGIVINPEGRAEVEAAIGAAGEHHVAAVARAGRPHGRHHINIVVGGRAGAVYRKENLAGESAGIDRAAIKYAAPEIHRGNLVESRGNAAILGVARTHAPERATEIAAADEKIAIGVDIQCSPYGRIRNTDWIHPRDAAIGRTAEQPTGTAGRTTPGLILKSVADAIGRINGEPLLVTALGLSVWLEACPGLPEVQ